MTKEKFVIRKGEGNALVVVDMQNDFVNKKGALYVRGIKGEPLMRNIIRRINSLLKKPFDYRAATRDSHPENHIEFSIFGRHCPKGEKGSFIVSDLDLFSGDDSFEVLLKGEIHSVISYSVVTSLDFEKHIRNLRSREIKNIFVTGLAYTHCVGESAIAYATQGFKTYIVRDATRSVPPPHGNPEAMDQKLKLYGVKIIYTNQISVR